MTAPVCAECGAALTRQTIEAASFPWRHLDIEDRRVSTCPGASLLPLGALVRVDVGRSPSGITLRLTKYGQLSIFSVRQDMSCVA